MKPDRRPLGALLLSTIVSLIGSQFTLIALPWFVLTTTGSASKAGLVGFATLLPGLAVGLFGGIFVDRLGYRRVSIVADMVSGISILAIPVVYETIGLQFWQLLTLVFFGSLLKVPSLTAHRSMVPEFAARAQLPLDRVNALFESLQNLALLLGTPLAGLLVAVAGARNVLFVDAATFAVSASLIAVFVPKSLFPKSAAEAGGYLRNALAGLAFIRRDRLLWPMVILLSASNATGGAVIGLVLPVYVEDHFGSAKTIGLAVAAVGAGAFLGSSIYGMTAHRVSRRLLWQIGFMLVPLEFWVFTLSPGIALLMAAFFLTGFVMGPINPLMVTLRHERSPDHLRGRVFSTYSAVSMAASPFGILVTGFAIDRAGFTPSVIGLAICAQLIGVAALLVPAFRVMDEPRPRSQSRIPDTIGSTKSIA